MSNTTTGLTQQSRPGTLLEATPAHAKIRKRNTAHCRGLCVYQLPSLHRDRTAEQPTAGHTNITQLGKEELCSQRGESV